MNIEADALVADDEPLLREELITMLAQAWPALRITAQARNGREAIAAFEAMRPHVCFLDVQMPGTSGLDVAQHIAGASHVVFVTAFEEHALAAFEQGAVDYLVKPVSPARLALCTERLQTRIAQCVAPALTHQTLLQLLQQLQQGQTGAPLRWLRASSGNVVHMICVDDVDYLRSTDKYTMVAWRRQDGTAAESLITMPLKSLSCQLDGQQFVQVHRSVVVNLRSVEQVCRGDNETATIHLHRRKEVLPVSRTFLHQFRHM